jgi:hypothetical protein
MRRDLWMILILGCLLILLLEAPAALSSVSAGLDRPYAPFAMGPSEVQAAERPSTLAPRPRLLQAKSAKSEETASGTPGT